MEGKEGEEEDEDNQNGEKSFSHWTAGMKLATDVVGMILRSPVKGGSRKMDKSAHRGAKDED